MLFFFLAGVASAIPLARSDCSGVSIYVARGTFEPQGFGLQQTVVNAILAKIPGSNASAVVYPASPVDISDSLASGVANTQQQITDYYNACPSSPIVLMGYSQGAQVIGDSLSGGGTGEPGGALSPAETPLSQSIGKNIISVILFGDPNRILGQGTDNEPDSCNVSSSAPRTNNQAAMSFYADRLDEYCASGDPVCCATGDNIFAHLSYFNTDNANAIADYVAEKYSS